MTNVSEYERIDTPGWSYALTESQMKSLLRDREGKGCWEPIVWFTDKAWARTWNEKSADWAVIGYFYTHREGGKQVGTLHWLPIPGDVAKLTESCIERSIWPAIVGVANQFLERKAYAS